MTNKEKFKHFSEKHRRDLPYSLQFDWWNEVIRKSWDVAIVGQPNQIIAVWPYFLKKKGPWKVISSAYFTPYVGPFMVYPENQKPSTKVSFEHKTLQALIDQLPAVASIEQKFHLGFKNGLSFQWNNFQESIGYTYVLDLSKSKEELWSNLRENIRRQIKKAEKELTTYSDFNASLVEKLFQSTFAQQNTDYPIGDDKIIERLVSFIEKHQSGNVLFAKDKNEATHSVNCCIYDAKTAYYLIGGSNANYKNSGAMSWLMWQQILAAKEKGCRTFNFEGSSIPSIERFIRGFGGELKSYHQIYKLNSKSLKIAERITSMK